MDVIRDIGYRPASGVRGLGDLYLPDDAVGAPAALVIHGGGWNAMDKHGLAGVAQFMAEIGCAAYNINYRLLDQAPWPGCGDDCLAAARFLLDARHEAMEALDRSRLVVIGGSAGGHLALMTGLRLDPACVCAIVSIAGPADLVKRAGDQEPALFTTPFWQKFFGIDGEATESMLREASPVEHVHTGAPPLLCVHSVNDQLVPLGHSERMVEEYGKVGVRAELFAYDGPGNSHGIWVEGTDPHRLLPHLENAIAAFLGSVR